VCFCDLQTQNRQPAYKDQEYRQYASVDQQLAYEANVDAYIAEAHRHQDFDLSVAPYSSPTAGYERQNSFHHEQFSGTSENPVRHFTQVTNHAPHGPYTSKSVHHRSDHFSQVRTNTNNLFTFYLFILFIFIYLFARF